MGIGEKATAEMQRSLAPDDLKARSGHTKTPSSLDLGIEAGRLAAGVYVVCGVGPGWIESHQMVVAR